MAMTSLINGWGENGHVANESTKATVMQQSVMRLLASASLWKLQHCTSIDDSCKDAASASSNNTWTHSQHASYNTPCFIQCKQHSHVYYHLLYSVARTAVAEVLSSWQQKTSPAASQTAVPVAVQHAGMRDRWHTSLNCWSSVHDAHRTW